MFMFLLSQEKVQSNSTSFARPTQVVCINLVERKKMPKVKSIERAINAALA
jgi:hypothetical protein